jgi:hypothetical protein
MRSVCRYSARTGAWDWRETRRVRRRSTRTAAIAGVDDLIQPIGYSFDDMSRPLTITSYAGETTDSAVRSGERILANDPDGYVLLFTLE